MYLRKLLPTSLYDLPVIEDFLAEQAARGLLVDDFSVDGTPKFIRGEPQTLQYCLLPRTKERDEHSGETLDHALQNEGWEGVCAVNRSLYVYVSANMAAKRPERPEGKSVRRQIFWHAAGPLMLLCIPALSVLFSIVSLGNGGIVDGDWTLSYYDWLIWMPFLMVAAGGLVLLCLLSLAKGGWDGSVWRKTCRGEKPKRRRGLQALFQIGKPLALAVLLLAAVSGLCFGGTTTHYFPASRTEGDFPQVRLETFQTEPVYYCPPDKGPSIDVARHHRLLIPDEVFVSGQAMAAEQSDWKADGVEGSPDFAFDLRYRRLRFSGMASKLLADERRQTMVGSGGVMPTAVDMPGFEETYCAQAGDRQYLWGRSGKVVVTLWYRGSGVLTDRLDPLSQALLAYKNS
ncbi:MAG: hypothetical protein RRY97_03790 [Oscillibacter sp.]